MFKAGRHVGEEVGPLSLWAPHITWWWNSVVCMIWHGCIAFAYEQQAPGGIRSKIIYDFLNPYFSPFTKQIHILDPNISFSIFFFFERRPTHFCHIVKLNRRPINIFKPSYYYNSTSQNFIQVFIFILFYFSPIIKVFLLELLTWTFHD